MGVVRGQEFDYEVCRIAGNLYKEAESAVLSYHIAEAWLCCKVIYLQSDFVHNCWQPKCCGWQCVST
jgi:hypothetical protein